MENHSFSQIIGSADAPASRRIAPTASRTRRTSLPTASPRRASPGAPQVPTLVIADGVPKGFRSEVAYTHYSLLRTIESAWSLAPLTANDAAASPMADFFPAA